MACVFRVGFARRLWRDNKSTMHELDSTSRISLTPSGLPTFIPLQHGSRLAREDYLRLVSNVGNAIAGGLRDGLLRIDAVMLTAG